MRVPDISVCEKCKKGKLQKTIITVELERGCDLTDCEICQLFRIAIDALV